MSIKWGKPIIAPITGSTGTNHYADVTISLPPLLKGEFFRITQINISDPLWRETTKLEITATLMDISSYRVFELFGQTGIYWEGSVIIPETLNRQITLRIWSDVGTTPLGFLIYQKGKYIP